MQSSLFTPVTPQMRRVKLDEIEPWESTGRNVTRKAVAALGMGSAPLLQETSNGSYRVIDGRRRLDAAKESGLEEVQALVLPANTGSAETLALTAALNLARTSSPLEEAGALGALIQEGYDEASLAKMLGISRGIIKKRLKLLALPETVRQSVRDKKVKPGVAAAIANLPHEQVRELEKKLLQSGKLTGDDIESVRRVGKEAQLAELGEALFALDEAPDPLDAFRQAVQHALAEGLAPEALEEAIREVVQHAGG
jgi:ParB family transcriptional regulator, chromosome partitioning protein